MSCWVEQVTTDSNTLNNFEIMTQRRKNGRGRKCSVVTEQTDDARSLKGSSVLAAALRSKVRATGRSLAAGWDGAAVGRVITCIRQRQCSVRARPRMDSCRCPKTPKTWKPLCWRLKGNTLAVRSLLPPPESTPPVELLTFSLFLLQPLSAPVNGRHLRLQGQVVLPDLLELLLQEGDPLCAGHSVELT